MKKILCSIALAGLATITHAADPLNASVWKTIDDETNQPKAQVVFNQQRDGSFTATIQKVLVPGEDGICGECEGQYHNKPLQGAVIVRGLKSVGDNKYEDGTIIDPKNGKSYRLKGELLNQNKTLKLRGYIGISLLGRNQIWQRIQ
ncbi:DUF2147 domain-containing protein [Acinetobacter rathckeae]|uniref:DUF2147 domain-containing protein n=1 Tax=Acinetobacter rathckeae TaxID=2605272 RepID=UPI0018A2D826|nr:DUF2147 domain-containing protein [Acinetobacter rathckeae]MBF7688247.1 DUF2147 domain-containing protein [Acinetobacter rathckeae]MBF7695235.1 DUF2147 domain-containing protein [Acinetobacter rathckeae]